MGCCCCGCYCSECVGNALCNNALCSSCLTGSRAAALAALDCMAPGSDTPITPAAVSMSCRDVSSCLPFAGTDGNGNDIYQMSCGKLIYSDGSAATQGDIACNCGACKGTVCSPRTCGSTTQPPQAKASGSGGAGSPAGGGSGSGSAKSAGSKAACNALNSQLTALQKAMSGLGSTMTSLLTGGKTVKTGTNGVIKASPVSASSCTMSSNAFLLVVLIIGAILLMMAFGRGRAA